MTDTAALTWCHVSETRRQASAGGFLFTIDRTPNYERRHPAMVHDYKAEAIDVHAGQRFDLQTHHDSHTARQRCAEFLIEQQKG